MSPGTRLGAAWSNGEHFKKSDFQIDLEANTCTCPAGQTTSEVQPLGWRKGKSGSRARHEAYVFAKDVCASCPLKESCFKQSEERNWGRVLYRHPRRRFSKRRGRGNRARTVTAFGRSDRWSSTRSRA